MPSTVDLKLFAERNTGSNYVEKLIALNLDVRIRSGIVSQRDVPTSIARRIRRLHGPSGGWLVARAREAYFARHFARDLGWKHTCPAPDRIGAADLAQVRFVALIKNPYSWLLSLQRRPYAALSDPDADLGGFVGTPFPILGMENIAAAALPPGEIWMRKVRSYDALIGRARYGTLLRYEDVLRDDEGAVARIARALDISAKGPFQRIEAAAKRADTTSRTDYAAYYLGEAWRAGLTPSAVRAYNAQLDPETVARMGYAMIDPEEVGRAS